MKDPLKLLRESYTKAMPVTMTDRHRGRLHECPLCGFSRWSVWGGARKHWQRHQAFVARGGSVLDILLLKLWRGYLLEDAMKPSFFDKAKKSK